MFAVMACNMSFPHTHTHIHHPHMTDSGLGKRWRMDWEAFAFSLPTTLLLPLMEPSSALLCALPHTSLPPPHTTTLPPPSLLHHPHHSSCHLPQTAFPFMHLPPNMPPAFLPPACHDCLACLPASLPLPLPTLPYHLPPYLTMPACHLHFSPCLPYSLPHHTSLPPPLFLWVYVKTLHFGWVWMDQGGRDWRRSWLFLF